MAQYPSFMLKYADLRFIKRAFSDRYRDILGAKKVGIYFDPTRENQSSWTTVLLFKEVNLFRLSFGTSASAYIFDIFMISNKEIHKQNRKEETRSTLQNFSYVSVWFSSIWTVVHKKRNAPPCSPKISLGNGKTGYVKYIL